MSSITWTIDDEDGTNPTGKAGVIEFNITFKLEPGDPGVMYDSNMEGYPGFPPQAHIDNAMCTLVWLDDEEKRVPTGEETKTFGAWFFDWLDSHPADELRLCTLGLEAGIPDHDNVDY